MEQVESLSGKSRAEILRATLHWDLDYRRPCTEEADTARLHREIDEEINREIELSGMEQSQNTNPAA